MIKNFLKLYAVFCFLTIGEVCAIGDYDYSDTLSPSRNPPNGLAASQVPQFVVLGFDDNKYQDGVEWAGTLMRNRTNPKGSGNPATFDSTPARASFYLMALPAYGNHYLKKALYDLYLDGNELGNHTLSHLDGAADTFTVAKWESEMTPCLSFLIDSLGIPAKEIRGFRTPFLSYNNNGFTATKETGFTYDCSIEEGEDTALDCSSHFWPYTLNKGSPGANFSAAIGSHLPIDSSHAGLWELPVYLVTVPADSECVAWGLQPGLRHRLFVNLMTITGDTTWDTLSGTISGLDYNVWFDYNMTAQEYVAVLKYNLDRRSKGNRSPFIFGVHSDFYSMQYISEPKGCKTTYVQRRQAMEQFLDYALSRQEVRVVPARDVISWMRRPVALNAAFNGPCTLTVSTVDSGEVRIDPRNYAFARGDTVNLTAIPGPDRAFDRWAGPDIAGTAPAMTIRMYKNMSVRAVFRKLEQVLDTAKPSANLVAAATWDADKDAVSKIISQSMVADTVSVTFWQAPMTGTEWPWITLTAALGSLLTDVVGIEVEYQCDKPLIVQFVQPEFERDNSYAMYQYVGPAGASQWNRILASVQQFYQPDWTPLASKKSLKLNTVSSMAFIPAVGEWGDTARLKIRKLRLFYNTSGIKDRFVTARRGPAPAFSVKNGMLVLQAAAASTYSIQIHSISGRAVFKLDRKACVQGKNIIRFDSAKLARGMYLISVKGPAAGDVRTRAFIKN